MLRQILLNLYKNKRENREFKSGSEETSKRAAQGSFVKAKNDGCQ